MPFSLSPLFAWFFVAEWTLRIVMLFVVPRRQRPSSANAWLLLIMISPTIGTPLFFMFGNPKLPKVRRAKRRQMDLLTQKELTGLKTSYSKLFAKINNPTYSTLSRLATVLGGLPAMNGNKVEILQDYNGIFAQITDEIDKAKEYVHVEYFIAGLDKDTEPVFDALERAVARGVKVRFLYDKVLSRFHMPRKSIQLKEKLDSIGVDYREMLPLSLLPGKNFTRPDLRNHRKIVVIDGTIAFSGSQNLITSTYNRKDDLYYEELVVKLAGPIVWQCNNVFRADWFAETGEPLLDIVEDEDVPLSAGSVVAQFLPSGPSHEHENNLKFYTSIVHAAKTRVGIVVPYFIPDESFLDAVTAASQRGVKVTVINSEVIDKVLAGHAQRSYYEELLEVGVDIYLYKKPILLHSKHVIIDDDIAVIGSSNLDNRSFELDLELDMILYDKDIVKQLDLMEKKYLERSQKVTLTDWNNRPIRHKMLDSIARLTAALQ